MQGSCNLNVKKDRPSSLPSKNPRTDAEMMELEERGKDDPCQLCHYYSQISSSPPLKGPYPL